jgi:hypothetical protein
MSGGASTGCVVLKLSFVVLGRVQPDRPAEAGMMMVPVMVLRDEHVW